MWHSPKVKAKYQQKCYIIQKIKVNSRTGDTNFKEIKETKLRGNVKTGTRSQIDQQTSQW